ncbi:alginate O-acetyltransferase AlgX-related protein [Fontibacillus sp. BL9]|uniref:alginate O-acetyltransferase AlgX-related protein n=1 Tax=Fontibacillus sp. BL9 TaxID=3389971 RepID=UPI00397CD544
MKLKVSFIVLCIFTLLVPSLSNMFPIRNVALSGVENGAQKPEFSLSGFYENTYQKQMEQYLNNNYKLRPYLVKSYNQMIYSLYNKSAIRDIEVGMGQTLYGRDYINDLFTNEASQWNEINASTEKLKKIQELMKQKGKSVLFVVAPNKASLYPENLPQKYNLAPAFSEKRLYNQFIESFKENKVDFIDSSEIMENKKDQFESSFFSKGGVHWNELGASVVLLEIFKKATKENPNLFVPEIKKIDVDQIPGTDEHDISGLMNLWSPLLSDVPHIKFSDQPTEYIRPKILMVGDSFGWQLVNILKKNEFHEKLDFLYYYNTKFSYPDETSSPIQQINWDEEVLNKDIVLIVFTEHHLSKSKDFIDDLYKVLTGTQFKKIDMQFSAEQDVKLTQVSGEQRYIITNLKENPSIYLSSSELNLSPGRNYTLRFKATGNKGNKLFVDFYQGTLPRFMIEIKEDQQIEEFNFTFSSTETSLNNCFIRFFSEESLKSSYDDKNEMSIFDISLLEGQTMH